LLKSIGQSGLVDNRYLQMQLGIINKFSIKLQLTAVVAFSIFLPMIVLVFISGNKFRELSENAAKSEAISSAQQYAINIQGTLNQVFAAVNTYAETYIALMKNNGHSSYSINEIHEIQKQFLITNPMGISVYTILKPGTIIDTITNQLNERLVILANDHVNDEFSLFDNWDYRFKSNVEDTLKIGKGYMLLPPYIDKTIGGKSVLLITYARAFESKGIFKGLVGIDISINWIQDFISKINIFNNNAQISIISNTGVINADNKNSSLVGKNVKEVLGSFLKENEKLMGSTVAQVKVDKNYIFYVPIQFNNLKSSWHIRIVVPEDEILKSAQKEFIYRTLIVILITVFALTISFFYFNQLTIRLSRIANSAKRIAEGNIDAEIRTDGNDEISDLGSSLQSVSLRFSNIISNLKHTLDLLAISAEDLSKTATLLFEGSSKQASSTEQVSSAMEQMSANIEQNTENAKVADIIAKKSAKEIEISSKNVRNTASSMGEIAKKITIINDIAFQVNILALNAEVEAARAGIHGKGFGVVAAEVGKLADRSKLAANEIDQLTNISFSIAKQSGITLEKIVPEIQKTAVLVREITNASIEQKSGTDQINIAIQQLNNVTHQNASSAEQLASNVENLSMLTDKLNNLISFFKFKNKLTSEVKVKRNEKNLHEKPVITESLESNEILNNNQINHIIENTDIIKITNIEEKGINFFLGAENIQNDGFEKF